MRALGQATLEEIDGDRWGPAPGDASSLVRSVHTLRTVPLAQLGPEGLRVLVGQRIGLDVVVPMAVGMLGQDPFVAGDLFPGDLLSAVLRAPDEWFSAHPAVAEAMRTIVAAVDEDATDEYGLHLVDDTDLPELLAAWRSPS